MFQPNSIKSLLSKRKSNRIQSASQQQNTKDSSAIQVGLDPDYQSMIEVKLMAKEIQSKIQSIRQWRQHQRQLMQQKIKLNSQLVDGINQVHLRNMEKEAERQQNQLKKILEKLKQKSEIKIKQNDEMYDSQRIFQVLTETENLRQQLQLKNLQAQVNSEDNYKKLVSQMNQINYIFKKQGQVEQKKENQDQKVDSKLLQKEMEEIQNQLKQIQDLLGSDDQDHNQKNK